MLGLRTLCCSDVFQHRNGILLTSWQRIQKRTFGIVWFITQKYRQDGYIILQIINWFDLWETRIHFFSTDLALSPLFTFLLSCYEYMINLFKVYVTGRLSFQSVYGAFSKAEVYTLAPQMSPASQYPCSTDKKYPRYEQPPGGGWPF